MKHTIESRIGVIQNNLFEINQLEKKTIGLKIDTLTSIVNICEYITDEINRLNDFDNHKQLIEFIKTYFTYYYMFEFFDGYNKFQSGELDLLTKDFIKYINIIYEYLIKFSKNEFTELLLDEIGYVESLIN